MRNPIWKEWAEKVDSVRKAEHKQSEVGRQSASSIVEAREEHDLYCVLISSKPCRITWINSMCRTLC